MNDTDQDEDDFRENYDSPWWVAVFVAVVLLLMVWGIAAVMDWALPVVPALIEAPRRLQIP